MADETETEDPWTQGAYESTSAFKAFVIYRDMQPKRSLARVGRESGKNLALIERWSSGHQWVVRARAWDAHQDAAKRAAATDAIVRMSERHAAAATTVMAKLLHRLAKLDPLEIGVKEIPHMMQVAVNVERLARGASTAQLALTGKEGGAVQHEHDVSDAAAQRLAALPWCCRGRKRNALSGGTALPVATAHYWLKAGSFLHAPTSCSRPGPGKFG